MKHSLPWTGFAQVVGSKVPLLLFYDNPSVFFCIRGSSMSRRVLLAVLSSFSYALVSLTGVFSLRDPLLWIGRDNIRVV